jgi:hypothetical protein
VAADLGLRGNVALYFLSPVVPHAAGIVCAVALLWALNLVLPAAVGAGWFLLQKRK